MEEAKIEQVPPEPGELDLSTGGKSDAKHILIIIGIILGIFVILFAGTKLYLHYVGTTYFDVDKLHQQNLKGDLPKEEGYVYNGFSVVKADGLWWTEIIRHGTVVKIPMHFGPKDVEDLDIKGAFDPSFNKGEVYIAINPTVANKHYTLSLGELNNNIVQGINRQIVSACTSEDPVCGNRSILNCEDTQGKAVIELVIHDVTEIVQKGSCLKIQGSGLNLTRAVDRVLYRWYGIMS